MPHWSLARPASSLQSTIRLAMEHGVSLAACIAGAGLHEEELRDPAREIEGRQELIVFRNILNRLPRELPFPLLVGQRYQPTMHGMWGFAILSSPNIRSAIEIGLRYFDLSFSFNRARLEINGNQFRLIYDDSDNPDDLRAALIEADIAALVTIQRSLLGYAIPFQSLQLRSPRPAYASAFEPLFGVVPQWDAAINAVGIDPSVLDLPMPLANELGLRVSDEQCRLLIEHRGQRSGLAGKVRGRILRKPGEFPQMETVAAELGMSARTLRNQLRREATSYRELLEEIRETLAEELLSTTRLTIDEIAGRLGYADTSSFVLAFKRWKGVSPRGYKREMAKSR
jgi:AraC-like DNA-binding protein